MTIEPSVGSRGEPGVVPPMLPTLPVGAGDPGDQQLVAKLRAGDPDAFEVLVRRYGGGMLASARRLLGNEEDGREVLQEALLAAFRAIGTFEAKSRLTTWLHRIVVNAALMRLRSRRCRPECSIEDLQPKFSEDGHHVEPPCPWSAESEASLLRAERRALVRTAIDELPPAYREVVLLRDIEGLSTEATGQLLGISANAAKIRLHRGRLALRTLLDRHFRDFR